MNKKTKITLIASVATLAVFGALKLKKFIKSRLTVDGADVDIKNDNEPNELTEASACGCEARECSPTDEAPCECASGR